MFLRIELVGNIHYLYAAENGEEVVEGKGITVDGH